MGRQNQYLPNQKDTLVAEMLKSIGVRTVDDLFSDIPEEILLKKDLNLEEGKSEVEVERLIGNLLKKNSAYPDYPCFLGGGIWLHHVPAIVDEIVNRTEFYTSYTPYQPEMSQGMLQALFEYQSLICDLTGMDVANSSLYDWATALGEAARMAVRVKQKKTVLVAANAGPERISVLRTYTGCSGIEVKEIPFDPSSGQVDLGSLENSLDDAAAVYVENPNFFGIVEDKIEKISRIAHEKDCLFIAGVDPISLGSIKPPGEYGADIVVGEGQPLGISMSFGGPLLGIFATRGDEEMIRQMPGRIIGLTKEKNGDSRAFTMILQTREQHIRREAATSNICTNQALCAVAAASYLALLGPTGLRELSLEVCRRAHYAAKLISDLPRVSCPYFSSTFFREFTLEIDGNEDSEQVFGRLFQEGIMGGLPLSRFYSDLAKVHLFSFTEMHTEADLRRLANAIDRVIHDVQAG